MIKKIRIPVLVIIPAAIFIHFIGTASIVGKTVNRFFPCEQAPDTSFPCYFGWDLVGIFSMQVLIVLSVVWIVVILVRSSGKRSSRK